VVDHGAKNLRPPVDVVLQPPLRGVEETNHVGYVRLGNYSTTLVEIALAPRTQVVRGLTVTSIDKISSWPSFDVFDVVDGLPALSTSFEGGEVLDLPRDFMVATRRGEIVVFWQHLGRCRGYRLGKACFLVADGTLAGVWFTKLIEAQTELFESQAEDP
jgi:hypothetical protein